MIVPRKFLILQINFFEFEARKNSSRSCSSDWGEPVTSFTVCSHHFQCVCYLNRFQMFGHSACELVRAFTSQGLKRCFGRWIDTLTGTITSNWPLNLKWVSNKWLDRVYLVDNASGNNYIHVLGKETHPCIVMAKIFCSTLWWRNNYSKCKKIANFKENEQKNKLSANLNMWQKSLSWVVSIDLFWVFFMPFSYNGVY